MGQTTNNGYFVASVDISLYRKFEGNLSSGAGGQVLCLLKPLLISINTKTLITTREVLGYLRMLLCYPSARLSGTSDMENFHQRGDPGALPRSVPKSLNVMARLFSRRRDCLD
jgi:hypothetical protein